MADITMPQLGETVTEGTITRWYKQVGDEVKEDEVLFEVSTEKVDSEVPAPTGGYLAEILVQEGETVDVGTKLAVISDAPPAAGGAAPAQEQAPEAPPPEPAEEPRGEEEPQPAAAAPAPEAATPVEESVEPAAQPAPVAEGEPGEKVLLSPVVRRLIAEHNLDPAQIKGTGAGGRITRNDVLAVIEGDGGARARRPAPAQEPAPAPQERQAERPRPTPAPGAPVARAAPMPAAKAGERDEVVPFSNIRRRTAEHMVRSKATSAHTLVAIEVDFDNVDRVRQPARPRFQADEGFSLTYLPFISRAVVDALAEFPHLNASVGDDQLIVHRYLNLGIAVDLNFEGLVVPVIHEADGKRLRALAREIHDLARRARSKKLSPDDITGGTFTVTNAGPYGTMMTGAIINQPQVAILSTDGVKKRPVVVEAADGSDAIAIHPVGHLVLVWDHRAVDGAYAAAFLAQVKDVLETRDWQAEL